MYNVTACSMTKWNDQLIFINLVKLFNAVSTHRKRFRNPSLELQKSVLPIERYSGCILLCSEHNYWFVTWSLCDSLYYFRFEVLRCQYIWRDRIVIDHNLSDTSCFSMTSSLSLCNTAVPLACIPNILRLRSMSPKCVALHNSWCKAPWT
jgi:hypothetical protein